MKYSLFLFFLPRSFLLRCFYPISKEVREEKWNSFFIGLLKEKKNEEFSLVEEEKKVTIFRAFFSSSSSLKKIGKKNVLKPYDYFFENISARKRKYSTTRRSMTNISTFGFFSSYLSRSNLLIMPFSLHFMARRKIFFFPFYLPEYTHSNMHTL